MVVLVHDAAEVAADEDASCSDEGGHGRERLVGEQVEVRGDDEAVAGELAGRGNDVYRDARVEEGPVPGADDRRQVEELRRVVGAVEGPPVVPAEEERDIGTGRRPGDLLELRRARFRAGRSRSSRAPPCRRGAASRCGTSQRPPRGGAPLEEHDAVRAVRECLVAQSRISPGRLGTFTSRQLTALTACSSRSQGWPPPSDRIRS